MPTSGDWSYVEPGEDEEPLSLAWDPDPTLAAGLCVSYDPLRIVPLDTFDIEQPRNPVPLSPVLTGQQPSRSSTSLGWSPVTSTSVPAITSWELQRRSSTDDGATFGAWAPVTGSPFAAATVSKSESSLATGTPEIVWQYRIRGINAFGPGDWSNVLELQWAVVVLQQPAAPTNLTTTSMTTTTRTLSYTIAADPTVTKVGVFEGATLVRDNIDPGLGSVTISPLVAGSTHAYTVAVYNGWNGGTPAGWSQKSNVDSQRQPTVNPRTQNPLLGVDVSGAGVADHGGFANWDIRRCYSQGDMMTALANANQLACIYSEDGPNLGGANPVYATIFNHALDVLNSTYYTGGATSQTHSTRWGKKLYWSNGNEMSDKGALGPDKRTGPVSQANIDKFVNQSQKALYDAVHYIDPATDRRRFPDAYAGVNPTTEDESNGIVQQYLHPAAKFCDFVAWSTYDPGRTNTAADPTFNWPSTVEADRTNYQLGYLVRCAYRTAQARAQARTDLNDPTFQLSIGSGEFAVGDDPSDSTTRPYWLASYIGLYCDIASNYDLEFFGACWWDRMKSTSGSQNFLGSGVPAGGSATVRGEPTTTNPSTAEVLRDWKSFNPRFGGTKPATWANNPKAAWKTTGTVERL